MRVIILPSSTEVSQRAAKFIARQVERKPTSVLGLATGSTPLGTYRELIKLHEAGHFDCSQTTTFNLDEYVGLSPDHGQSYSFFMRENLFKYLNIDLARCHVPDGLAEDFESYCVSYEQEIQKAGGIDLQLLGLGSDGHIAFNEPTSSLASRTRLKALTQQTRLDNARFFDSLAEVPTLAVTMGIGTILEARNILLLACGAKKASAVRSMIEGPISSFVPASALQLHANVTVILDEPAAGWLIKRDYYLACEQVQQGLEKGPHSSISWE